MFPRWRKITAQRLRRCRTPRSATGSRRATTKTASAVAVTIDASEAKRVDEEDDEPEGDAADGDERREREGRTACGRDHLPALLESKEHRPGVTDHRRSGRENADERAADPEPERRRGEALRDVEQGDGSPSDRP